MSPAKALEKAIHMENRAQNEQKINKNLNNNTQSVHIFNSFKNRNRTTNYQQQRQGYNRNSKASKQYNQLLSLKIAVGAVLKSTAKPAQHIERKITTVES